MAGPFASFPAIVLVGLPSGARAAPNRILDAQQAATPSASCNATGPAKLKAWADPKTPFSHPHRVLTAIRRHLPTLIPLILGVLFLILAANPAHAQAISIDLGDDGSLAGRSIQLLVLITVLSLVPGLAIMVTCFPFIVTVLAILRQAIGLQQSPPNMLMVSLALFLTYFVMEPVFTAAWTAGVQPMMDGTMTLEQGFVATMDPFRTFMAGRIAPDTFETLAALRPDMVPDVAIPDAPLSVLVPSFMLSEVERAFQVGFLIYLPFLIIDLVVAAILMSMGMMMVPPAIVSLPFKLAFFVVADGWALISGSLVQGYL
jgi:flagellar biosynthesis protein FliP